MKKPSMLVVEDESVVAMDIEEALLSLNYDVVGIAPSGLQALDLLEKSTPDLVLMDIFLEGEMDGIEAATKLREKYDIPVVFLTAYADKPTLDRAKVVEPYGYVLKPFRPTELRTVIELALYKHRKDLEKESVNPPEQSKSVPDTVPQFQKLLGVQHAPSEAMQVTIRSLLESTAPFSQLDELLISEIAKVSSISSYQAGEIVIREGTEKTHGFLVLDGRISIFKASSGGKELVVELLGRDDLFGVLSVLERAPSPFAARAQTDLRMLWLPKEVVYHIVEKHPLVSRELFEKALERLRKAHDLSRSLAHDKVEIRIASALMALKNSFGDAPKGGTPEFEFEMTRQELGELVGTTPETISRLLNRMEHDGIVDLSKTGFVKVLQEGGLKSILQNG